VNLLDRYIFRSVLGTCLGAVGLFAFVLIVGNAMKELMGYLLAGQIDLMVFLKLIALLVPFVVTFALPMGVLTGVLLTLGRLSADSEVTAMRACGISLTRIARPVWILGLLFAATAFYINHEAMPWARVVYKRELAQAVRANPVSFLVPRTFIRQFPGMIVYVGERNGSAFSDIRLWQLDGQQRVIRQINAASGKVDYDEAANTLVLTLRKAVIESRREKTPEDPKEPQLIGSFEETEAIRLNLDRLFTRGVTRTKLDFMPYEDLMAERTRLEKAPAQEAPKDRDTRERTLTRIKLVVSERFNNALAVFSFALIGVPLGIRVSRRETSANLGLAVGLALGYYFLTTAIGWLDKRPDLYPWYLFYLPNLLFCATAAWLFSRVGRK